MSEGENMSVNGSAARGRALVFDSGVGGLTVVDELRAVAPEIHVDYAADTGFFPYGDKSDAELRCRLPNVAEDLVSALSPDVFVIACNTASTLALPEVRERISIPVVGTVPAIKPAGRLSKTGKIGLLATPGTIRRDYTSALISEFAQDVDVVLHGSIELVSLAERVARGETPDLAEFAAAQASLFDQDEEERIDTIVLACTHFPLVRAQLEASAPRPINYIDSGGAIARQTCRILTSLGGDSGRAGRPRAVITSDPARHPELVDTFHRFGFKDTEQLQDVLETRPVAQVSFKQYKKL